MNENSVQLYKLGNICHIEVNLHNNQIKFVYENTYDIFVYSTNALIVCLNDLMQYNFKLIFVDEFISIKEISK